LDNKVFNSIDVSKQQFAVHAVPSHDLIIMVWCEVNVPNC